MGHVGDEVRAERFCTGQLLCHGIDGLADLIEALHAGTVHRRNTDGKVPLHDLLRGGGDQLYRAIHHEPAPDVIDGSEQEGQEQHIQEGDLCRRGHILLRKDQPHGAGQGVHKHQHTAGNREGDHQKENHIVVNGLQHPPEGRLPHLITAL